MVGIRIMIDGVIIMKMTILMMIMILMMNTLINRTEQTYITKIRKIQILVELREII